MAKKKRKKVKPTVAAPETDLALDQPPPPCEAILRLKEKRFIIEYIKTLDPQRAAKAVGYSATHGYKLLSREWVQQAIAERVARIEALADVDITWVMERLKDIYDKSPKKSYYVKLNALAQLTAVLGLGKVNVDVTSKGDKIEAPRQVMIFAGKEIEF